MEGEVGSECCRDRGQWVKVECFSSFHLLLFVSWNTSREGTRKVHSEWRLGDCRFSYNWDYLYYLDGAACSPAKVSFKHTPVASRRLPSLSLSRPDSSRWPRLRALPFATHRLQLLASNSLASGATKTGHEHHCGRQRNLYRCTGRGLADAGRSRAGRVLGLAMNGKSKRVALSSQVCLNGSSRAKDFQPFSADFRLFAGWFQSGVQPDV